MAVYLGKLVSIKANGISKALMPSYITSLKVICNSEWSKCSLTTNFVRKIHSGKPQAFNCNSSQFSSLFHVVPSIVASNNTHIELQSEKISSQIFYKENQQYSLFFISILAVLGIKAFNSISVLADEVCPDDSNLADHNSGVGEDLKDDCAINESEEYIVLDDATFSQVFPEELSITDPIEISDVQSLRHSHIVREAAGVSAESSLVLVIRASRALLAALEDYRVSLIHLLDLISYNVVLINKLGQGAVYEEVLKQVTDAMVEAKSGIKNSKKRVTDLQLLVRVSVQAMENLSLCCHLSGADATALASGAAVTTLRSQVEAAEAEVRQLQRDVLAKQAEIIAMENTRQRDAEDKEPAEDMGQQEKEEASGERRGVRESQKGDEELSQSQVVFGG